MSDYDEDEPDYQYDPSEVGDIVVFQQFGNGVSPNMVGKLGLLLEDKEVRREIYVFDHTERMVRSCVRVRAETGDTVGAQLRQLETYANTGATLVEALGYSRWSAEEREKDRQLTAKYEREVEGIRRLIEKIRREVR